MENITIKDISNLSSSTLKKFGLVFGALVAILFGIIPWLIHSSLASPLIWMLAVSVSTIALLKPRFLKIPYFLWMKLGYYMGCIQNRIVLGVIFYLILLPTAIVLRLFKHAPIAKKPDLNLTSYRIMSDRKPTNMRKPF